MDNIVYFLKFISFGPARPSGYHHLVHPQTSWVRDPGKPNWTSMRYKSYGLNTCVLLDSGCVLQSKFAGPLFPPYPCHEEWSVIVTCFQVRIMRGESPKILCSKSRWVQRMSSHWSSSTLFVSKQAEFKYNFLYVCVLYFIWFVQHGIVTSNTKYLTV